MPAKIKSAVSRLSIPAVFALWLIACCAPVSGTYTGSENTFFDRLTFKSGGKVDITFAGMTAEGAYEVDGKQVQIIRGGEAQVLTIDDQGCLDGGAMIGKYCKGGGSAPVTASSEPLLGIYHAGNEENGITLNFQSGKKVTITLSGEPIPSNGYYEISGNRINVTVPGGMPMTLVSKGNVLEATMDGSTITFVRQ